MAQGWVKVKIGFAEGPQVSQIAGKLGISEDLVVTKLLRLAGWFEEFGEYGWINQHPTIVDELLKIRGFGEALAAAGWLKNVDGYISVTGYCDQSAKRKSIGKKLRDKILAVGECAICSAPYDLVVDHKTPVCRGGKTSEGNLQCLCSMCNRKKWKMTMEEFLAVQP